MNDRANKGDVVETVLSRYLSMIAFLFTKLT